MSSAVSLPKLTFTVQAKSSKRLTSIVHILSPENVAAFYSFNIASECVLEHALNVRILIHSTIHCTKSNPGICSPLIHYTVSNNSVSGQ